MNSTKQTLIIAAAAVALLAGLTAKPASAQTSFTDGDFGGSGAYTLVGWTAGLVPTPPGTGNSLKVSDNESLDGLNDYGNVHFNTGGTNPGSTLSQTFSDTTGTIYTVGYQFGNNDVAGVTSSQEMSALIDGDTLSSETITGTSNTINQGIYSFTFVGTGSDTLEFTDAGSTAVAGSDGILENVSVTGPAPEASTLVGGGLAAFLMLGLSMRSRKLKVASLNG